MGDIEKEVLFIGIYRNQLTEVVLPGGSLLMPALIDRIIGRSKVVGAEARCGQVCLCIYFSVSAQREAAPPASSHSS